MTSNIELNQSERKALAVSFFAAANALDIPRLDLLEVRSDNISEYAGEMTRKAEEMLKVEDAGLKSTLGSLVQAKAEAMLGSLKAIPRQDRTDEVVATIRLEHQQELVLEFFEVVEGLKILDRSVLENTVFAGVIPAHRTFD